MIYEFFAGGWAVIAFFLLMAALAALDLLGGRSTPSPSKSMFF